MKLEQNPKSMLFSFTEIPDVFFTEYLSMANGNFVKIYLYILFLSKYNKDIKINDLSKTLSLDFKIIQEGLKFWEDNGVLTKKNNGYILNSLQEIALNKIYTPRLTATPEIAAKRLLNDNKRGAEDSNYNSLEEAKIAREKRRLGEQERYKERYGIDLENSDNYDLIIDTSFANIDDTADVILNCLDYYIERKPFTKTWTSPASLLPLQGERETLSYTENGYDLEAMEASIRKNGYLPDSPIEIAEYNGLKGIIEGHHRNFAAAILGKTLIPYELIAKDDEKIKYGAGTAKQRIEHLDISDLYGHEWMVEEGMKGKRFSYDDVYPKIYEKLKNKHIEKQGESR